MTKPNFEIAIDTRLIYQRLVQVKEGQQITYTELSSTVSRSVAGNCPNLQSALRRARRDDDMVFDNIRGVGYRRLTASEIVASSQNDISGLRRRAKRSTEKLFKVKDFSSLTNDEKLKHATSASIFGAITASLTKKGVGAVEKAVKATGHEIPVAETLRLFAN